jgi:hypothetical protein
MDGRIHIELLNGAMLFELKATPADTQLASSLRSSAAGSRSTGPAPT